VETRGVDDLHAALYGEPHTWTSLATRSRKSGYAPVEMTKGRAVLPVRVVAEGLRFCCCVCRNVRTKRTKTQAEQRPRISGDQEWGGKHIGYSHIRAQYAEPLQRFYDEYLNPYLNFHRPSALRLIISIQFSNQKGAFLNCLIPSPSGSFFNWKRLRRRRYFW
jgi:hypothetical protein